MKQRAALLSLPLLIALLLAPPAPHSTTTDGPTDQSRLAHTDFRLRVTDWSTRTALEDPAASWLKTRSRRRARTKARRGSGDEDDDASSSSDEEDAVEEALVAPPRPVSLPSPLKPVSIVAQLPPVLPVAASARSVVLMLDFLHTAYARNDVVRATSVLRSIFHSLREIPLHLAADSLRAKPNAVHALARLLASPEHEAKQVARMLIVPDAAVFSIACIAVDRSVTETLLSTRSLTDASHDGDEFPLARAAPAPTYSAPPASRAVAAAMLRMFRDNPSLLTFGSLAGHARRDVQLAWFDHTRRDRDILHRHALERWLFGAVMSRDVQNVVLDAYASGHARVLAHGWSPEDSCYLDDNTNGIAPLLPIPVASA